MTTSSAAWSPQTSARLAGGLYVVGIALGLFAELVVRGGLTAWSDAARNAGQIVAGEQLYRLGFAAGVLILMINIPLAVILYRIFRVAREGAALTIAFAILAGTAIEAANLLNHYEPLVLLGKSAYLAGVELGDRQTLASVRLFSIGYAVALCFFALYDIAVGYAILRTRFLPRAVGVLMILAGLCYLTNSFALFVAPPLAAKLYPLVLVPCFIGELAMATWLLVFGVSTDRWNSAARQPD